MSCFSTNYLSVSLHPTFSTPSDIDLLLGSDIYYELLSNGTINLGKNLPTLFHTHLGWAVGGRLPQSNSRDMSRSLHLGSTLHNSNFDNSLVTLHSQNYTHLKSLISKFWSVEDPRNIILSPDDELAESIFHKTTVLLENGRFATQNYV